MSTGRSGLKPPPTKDAPPADQALAAELVAELDEAAADVVTARLVGAERHEAEMRHFLLALRRESRRAAGRRRRTHR
jgi:hypothetical protein